MTTPTPTPVVPRPEPPKYFDKPLELKLLDEHEGDVNIWAIAATLKRGFARRVHLEPGDGTRYTMLLAVIGTNLYLVRLRGYDVVGAVVLPIRHYLWEGEFEPIANGNPHSLAVLRWFVAELCWHLLDGKE